MAIWFPTTTGESYNITIKPMLQIGLTAYNFEPFKRQPFDLNLGINLFDKDNPNIIDNCVTGSSLTLESVTGCKTLYVPCEPNTTYTISKVASTRFIVVTTNTTPAIGVSTSARIIDLTGTTITITTGSNAKYICVFYYYFDTDTLSEQQILNSIMINKGSQALPYCNYFTPIELCKIDCYEANYSRTTTYQDYLYNTGGKWYKHQEVGKMILTGNEPDWAAFSVNYEYQLPFDTKASFDNDGIFMTGLYSSHFKNTDQTSTNMSNYAFTFFASAGYRWFRFRYNEKTSLADFKTWLASNNVIMYYPLKASQELEITDPTALYYLNTIKAFAQSYYGTTNIMITTNNAQPTMKVQTLDKIGG